MAYMNSPLKWAGSKFRILDQIFAETPHAKVLIEPFVGAGNVFLNARKHGFEEFYINDANAALMMFWRTLRDEYSVTKFMRNIVELETDESRYKFYRDIFNIGIAGLTETHDPCLPHIIAGTFFYLNRHGFNGLYRTNAMGEFNVGWGKRAFVKFPQEEIEHAHAELQCVKRLSNMHFNSYFKSLSDVDLTGAVIYCDPPYLPLSKTANFTTYNGSTFTLSDHNLLVIWAEQLAERGATVIISNHDTIHTQSLYYTADKIERFPVRRSISCKIDERVNANEILVVYKPE